MSKNNIGGEILAVAGKVKKNMQATSTYNPEKLLELINAGMTAQDICRELNIKHLQVLKAHVMKLMSSKRIFIEVPGLFIKSSKQAYVNKNGDIKICMKNIDLKDMKLIPNLTEFSVFVEGDRIVLQKVGPAHAMTEKKTEEGCAADTVEPTA